VKLYLKKAKAKSAKSVDQVVEHMPIKALSSNLSVTKNKMRQNKIK
jgi:hypothetical protein